MKLYRTTSNHYFVKDDDVKIKVSRGFSQTVEIRGGDHDGIYDLDYAGIVYDSGKREWDEELGKYFYPFASEDVVNYITRVFETINNK